MILVDKLYSEPLLTAVFGVFLIALAISLKRLSALLSLGQAKHPAEQEEIRAKPMEETLLGDLSPGNLEISTSARLGLTPAGIILSNAMSSIPPVNTSFHVDSSEHRLHFAQGLLR